MSFQIAGQRGAISQMHQDASGFGTIVYVHSGVKVWCHIFEDTNGNEVSVPVVLRGGDLM
jgi:hypothetical protein